MRHSHSTLKIRGIAATLAIGLLGACAPGDGARQQATQAALAAATTPPEAAEAAVGEAATLCALLTAGEIEAAFGGAVQASVGDSSAGREQQMCEYRIRVPGYEEGQMLLQRMDARAYGDRKAMYSSGGYGMEPVPVEGLGQDAYTMGDAQVEVKVSDREAFNLGFILLTRREPPVTPEQVRAAMVELAGTVAQRM